MGTQGETTDRRILGINERSYRSRFSPTGYVNVTVVLVAGSIGDYAAYIGEGNPEWVARYGDKLGFTEATCHFPGQLERERYRE